MASLLLTFALVQSTLLMAAPPAPAPITEQARNNRPYLLIFPVIVFGVIGALVVITRKKK